MVAEEVFVKFTIWIPLPSVTKGNLQGILHNFLERGWSWGRNSDLGLRGAGAEKNIFASATLARGWLEFKLLDEILVYVNFRETAFKCRLDKNVENIIEFFAAILYHSQRDQN